MLFIAPSLPAAAQPADGTPRQYRVQPGDTLRLIARRFYGAKRHWFRIYQANRAAIGANPNLIHAGAVFTLPAPPRASLSTPPKVSAALPMPPKLPQPGPTLDPSSVLPIVEIAPAPPPPLASPAPTPEPLADARISLPETESRVSPYLPAAASLIVPGSAQIARGDWDRGLTHLGLSGLALGASLVGNQNADSSLQWTGGLSLIGISLWSAWDAYQHAEAVTRL
jgi:phage tail protein X